MKEIINCLKKNYIYIIYSFILIIGIFCYINSNCFNKIIKSLLIIILLIFAFKSVNDYANIKANIFYFIGFIILLFISFIIKLLFG